MGRDDDGSSADMSEKLPRFSPLCLAALAGCSVPGRVISPGAYGLPSFPVAATAVAAAPQPAAPAAATRPAFRDDGSGYGALAGELAARGAADGDGRLSLMSSPWLGLGAPQEPEAPPVRQDPEAARWSDFLPFGREAVLAAGYELPRAFGFGVAYTRLRRDIEVDEVRVGLNGADPTVTQFLSVEADSVVDNVMGRLDAWILPFWNVSVLGGWTWNESDSVVTVSIPLPINPQDVTFAVPTRQEGPTWGVGTNLAGGYGEWFISGDAQWINADMSDFAVIEAFLASLRSGWNGKVDGKPVRLWGGVTWWDTATTIEGDAATAGGTLRFEVDQGPVTPWSLQIGGSIDLSPAYGAVLEFHHYRDVRMLVVSGALRF
jgi:hypothetical protein